MRSQKQRKIEPARPGSRKEMTEQIVHFELTDPSAAKVCLAGTFNNWNPDEGVMRRFGEGRWTKDLSLRRGTYEYRLVVDGKWVTDPNADHTVGNPFGERNSLLTVS